MAEYIEREAAIAWFMPYVHAGGSIEADVVISYLKGMKAADVVPVRHGRWNDWEVFWKECSCCGYRTQKINVREYFFCPNCGADMRGSNDE